MQDIVKTKYAAYPWYRPPPPSIDDPGENKIDLFEGSCQGSTGSTYNLKFQYVRRTNEKNETTWMITTFCSCPAWRWQKTRAEHRTCKHIATHINRHHEMIRITANQEFFGGETYTPAPRAKPAKSKVKVKVTPTKKIAKKSTVTKATKPSVVPPPSIHVTLAQKWDKKKDPTNYYMSEKLDGMRCLWDGKKLMSRNGKEIFAPQELLQQLPPLALDGELFLGRGQFQHCMKIVRTQCPSAQDWKKITYMVFDAPTVQGPLKQRLEQAKLAIERVGRTQAPRDFPDEYRCPITLNVMVDPCLAADGHSYEREAIQRWFLTHGTSPMTNKRLDSTNVVPNHALRNAIARLTPEVPPLSSTEREPKNTWIKILDQQICQGPDHVVLELKSVLAKGGEGVMLKHPTNHYKQGRTWDLMKVKQFHDDEAEIIGYKDGTGKNEGKVGSLQCRNKEGKEFYVGSGLDEHLRDHPPRIGTFITYRYQEKTLNGIPRFPTFVRLYESE